MRPGYDVHTVTLTTEPPAVASTADPIVIVDRVTKSYGTGSNQVTAVCDVSLSIQPGTSVALLGRSGSGKSTLLNLLGAVDRPTSGSIRIGSQDLSRMSDAELALFRRRRLGFVFQSFHLVPSLTVFDGSAWPTNPPGIPTNSPADSSSASRWPARSCIARRWCWPMNRPEIWTHIPAG
jgi:predicted ABC-type transport system involved in lysophospholipase L1 biosynthesis ATPase subunit